MNIVIYNRDEIFIVSLEYLMYLKADGHFTEAYYKDGTKMLLPFSITQIWDVIVTNKDIESQLMKSGRSFIINLGQVRHISLTRETLTFAGAKDVNVTENFNKAVLKELAEYFKTKYMQLEK